MKHMILIYGNHESWNAMDADAFKALMNAHETLQTELKASGEFVESNELGLEGSKIVRRANGVVAVTDGPFVEIHEIVAGYYVVDCVSIDRAVEIAGTLAEAEYGLVEVRQMNPDPEH